VSRFTLILRSLAFHWRVQLAAGLAAAVGTAVLVGALLVGDSVRYSLKAMALERLGRVQSAVLGGDRFFRADLAQRMNQQTTAEYDSAEPPQYLAMILVNGTCVAEDSGARAGNVQLLGVPAGFWLQSENGASAPPKSGQIVLNQGLAGLLRAKPGDTVRLRIGKPGLLSLEAPVAPKEAASAVFRAKVGALIPDKGLGRFGFNASQSVPLNAFLPLADMQAKLGQKGRANVLLALHSLPPPPTPSHEGRGNTDDLARSWSLDDAQLRLRAEAKLGFVELATPRVFLDDAVAAALLNRKAEAGNLKPGCVLSYFVNSIRAGGRETPYSMVTAGEPPLVPADLKEDEIILNEWTAEDLQAKPGDKVELEYFTVVLMRKLDTHKAAFTVKAVVPIEGMHADRNLMPEFPGIADVDSTHDWDSSIPIDMRRIRPKDEQYWKDCRGTPKAFIALNAGVRLWKNRFGTYTALRFPMQGEPETAKAAVDRHIRATIDPAVLGLQFTPVRELARRAVEQATDFGGLFLGLSFFLIAAALLLMTLIFRFNVEARATETGLLLALGFTPRSVRRLLWSEGAVMAALGSILGVGGGALFARFLLHALTTRWREAVAASTLEYHAEPASFAIGYAAGVAAAMLAIMYALRRQAALPARELLAAGAEPPGQKVRLPRWVFLGVLSFVAALGLATGVLVKGELSAPAFFGVGALLLLSGLSGLRLLLGGSTGVPSARRACLPTLSGLGVRAASRRSSRSLGTAGLLACGTFLVVAVGANQQDATRGSERRESGTGGFALEARTTLPVYEDLNTSAGRLKAGVAEEALAGVTLYPFRVKDGDEASCLNLNRAQQPRILGVPEAFIRRGGFTFVTGGPRPLPPSWELLHDEPNLSKAAGGVPGEEPIRGVCDFQSLTWALGMKTGDELTVRDETGAPQRIRIVAAVANSILQGSILISERDFMKLYPSESGYREFLVDAPRGRAAEAGKRLSAALQDEGLEATSAVQRLAEFNAVQNTYLATFQALGALGLLLGSLGLGVVVLRNMLERRAELALLRALGFSRGDIGRLVLSEHLWLLLLGLGLGVVAALAAVAPVLAAASAQFPWKAIGAAVAALALCGLGSALLATWAMLRAPLLPALRND